MSEAIYTFSGQCLRTVGGAILGAIPFCFGNDRLAMPGYACPGCMVPGEDTP